MSATELTMEQLERRMARIMIVVDERAAASVDNALVRATCAEMVGAPAHSPGKKEEEEEEKEDEVDDAPVPAPPADGGGDNNCSAGKPRAAAPRARAALRMDFASCYLPDHDEDAHFGHAKAGFVGGYRDKGVDAGAFARALMKHALAAAKQAATTKRGKRSSNQPVVTPDSLLQRAYIKAARARATGASTAVVLSLRGGTLRWAYVGDSGFAVLRGGKAMAHRSAPQQHRFNSPYQLRAGGGGDRVADAAVGEVAVAEGDVVVVGTDGLFDNVFDAELEWVVRTGTTELGLSPQGMADKIAAVARKMSRRSTPSPYSVESARRVRDGKRPHYGGKVDDITVVVAYIVSKDS